MYRNRDSFFLLLINSLQPSVRQQPVSNLAQTLVKSAVNRAQGIVLTLHCSWLYALVRVLINSIQIVHSSLSLRHCNKHSLSRACQRYKESKHNASFSLQHCKKTLDHCFSTLQGIKTQCFSLQHCNKLLTIAFQRYKESKHNASFSLQHCNKLLTIACQRYKESKHNASPCNIVTNSLPLLVNATKNQNTMPIPATV